MLDSQKLVGGPDPCNPCSGGAYGLTSHTCVCSCQSPVLTVNTGWMLGLNDIICHYNPDLLTVHDIFNDNKVLSYLILGWWLSEWVTPIGTAIPDMTSLDGPSDQDHFSNKDIWLTGWQPVDPTVNSDVQGVSFEGGLEGGPSPPPLPKEKERRRKKERKEKRRKKVKKKKKKKKEGNYE